MKNFGKVKTMTTIANNIGGQIKVVNSYVYLRVEFSRMLESLDKLSSKDQLT